MLALGIVSPVLPGLIVEFENGDVSRAAHITGVFGFIWALMQFFAAPALGVLSDRFGRRPVVLLSMAGLGLDYILMALAPSLGWLLLRTYHFRHYLRHLSRRGRLRLRHHADRTALRPLRHSRRLLRSWLRHRSRRRRSARRHRPSPPLLGRRRSLSRQRLLRRLRSPRITPTRSSLPVFLETRQPVRRPRPPSQTPRTLRSLLGRVAHSLRSRRASQPHRALHEFPLRLG